MASYAIIPAAGESRRMGEPKLMLPWGQGTIIDAVLQAWSASRVDQLVVIVRADNRPLQKLCLKHNVEVVIPEKPPEDMKRSVLYGLDYISRFHQPLEADKLLVAPADMPELSAALIDLLLDAHDPTDPRLLAPRVDARRGHPLLVPWGLSAEMRRLEEDEGINKLWERLPSALVDSDQPGALLDVDTPEQYQQYQQYRQSDGKNSS